MNVRTFTIANPGDNSGVGVILLHMIEHKIELFEALNQTFWVIHYEPDKCFDPDYLIHQYRQLKNRGFKHFKLVMQHSELILDDPKDDPCLVVGDKAVISEEGKQAVVLNTELANDLGIEKKDISEFVNQLFYDALKAYLDSCGIHFGTMGVSCRGEDLYKITGTVIGFDHPLNDKKFSFIFNRKTRKITGNTSE